MEILHDYCDVFNEMPLIDNTGHIQVDDILMKVTGMNSDHAEDQKKVACILEQMKSQAWIHALGNQALLAQPIPEFLSTLSEVNVQKFMAIGGPDAWEQLSEEEWKKHDQEAYDATIQKLGWDSFNNLAEPNREYIGLFIWAGCTMHKEMNCFKGGCKTMAEVWGTMGILGPKRLFNCDNDAVARHLLNGIGASTSAKIQAIEAMECGAVKATSLAGTIFNHKDDKKGEQDYVHYHFTQVIGHLFQFPDVSNTWYGSHGKAAGILFLYQKEYIWYLEIVQDHKQKTCLNHMEQNLFDALHDIPILTELAVLALYTQSVSHPYMVEVQGLEVNNILHMGPFHEHVKAHMGAIVENLDPLLFLGTDYKNCTLDGKPWQWPEIVAAIHEQAVGLPHLQVLLITFLKGALETWIHFTSEFMSGGRIDHSTAAQWDQAYMPTTNDANEGMLRSKQVYSRNNPTGCNGCAQNVAQQLRTSWRW
jgi:hypothetical protein